MVEREFPNIGALGYIIISKVNIYYKNESYSTRRGEGGRKRKREEVLKMVRKEAVNDVAHKARLAQQQSKGRK